jgi:F-type H+-transporting ATPase subunit delta
MKVTIDQYVSALVDASSQVAPDSFDVLIENLTRMLVQNGDLDKFEAIVSAYEARLSGIAPALKAEVTTAEAGVMNKDIADELNRIAGKELELEQKVDPSLIGGVVLRLDDTVIDASVRGSLEQLRKTLIN